MEANERDGAWKQMSKQIRDQVLLLRMMENEQTGLEKNRLTKEIKQLRIMEMELPIFPNVEACTKPDLKRIFGQYVA